MNISIYNCNEPKWNKTEILRYAGIRQIGNEEAPMALLEECISEAKSVLNYNLVYSRLPISRFLNKTDLGFTMSSSEKLAEHLEGCSEIFVFAATLGIGIDRLINKYSRISPAKGVLMQAIGAERIEALCDDFEVAMTDMLLEENLILKPRYSPGYGDFSLGVQVDLFNYLDCSRRIGLTLNDSLLMSPSKSVTAIIGICDPEVLCISKDKKHDCTSCELLNCIFRR